MKSGLIVYDEIGAEKNLWFIDRCLFLLDDEEVSLVYVQEDDVINYVNNDAIDFVIYRGRNYHLLENLNKRGIETFNNVLTNKTANNKLLTAELLQKLNLPFIPTFLDSSSLHYPFITKTVSGHGGKEVFLVKDKAMQRRLLKQYEQLSFIYQEYLPNDGDVRLYVLDDKVIAAVKRINSGDFRNNYSLGGEVSLYEPSKEMVDAALLIAKTLGSTYIGVDFLLTKDGYRIIEIEDPVGSRMLYKVSDIDIIKLFCGIIKEKI